jgi:hypothetical protein
LPNIGVICQKRYETIVIKVGKKRPQLIWICKNEINNCIGQEGSYVWISQMSQGTWEECFNICPLKRCSVCVKYLLGERFALPENRSWN